MRVVARAAPRGATRRGTASPRSRGQPLRTAGSSLARGARGDVNRSTRDHSQASGRDHDAGERSGEQRRRMPNHSSKSTSVSLSARIAVVGTSWWVERMHLPALLSCEHAELVAFCGRDPARAAALAERVAAAGRPRPAVETRWEALVARPDVDAVVVSVPDDLHAPVARAALDAGLHVCCEKPLARTAADARAMHDAATARGRLAMTYFTYRWLPHYRLARALVRGDARAGVAPRVGRVRQVHVRFLSAMGRGGAPGGTFMPAPRDPWRQDPRRSGGVLTDLGTHVADLVRVVAGDVDRVAASVRTDGPGAVSDAVVLALEGRGAGGAAWHGSVHLATAVAVGDRGLLQSLLVVGEDATLDVAVTVQGAAVRLYAGGRTERPETPAAYGSAAGHPFAVFTALPVGVRLFAEAVGQARTDGGRAAALAASPEWASFADGLAAQEVVDAAARAARSGRWEAVPAAGDPPVADAPARPAQTPSAQAG